MRAALKTELLQSRLARAGISLSHADCATLRRAAATLARWGEMCCGNSNDYASWAIERDDTTGRPYLVTHPHKGNARRRPVADREAGALRRVAAVCAPDGLHFYHQTDCRGASLYVGREPLTSQNYHRATCCAIE